MKTNKFLLNFFLAAAISISPVIYAGEVHALKDSSTNNFLKKMLPVPQQATLTPTIFSLENDWAINTGTGVEKKDPAVLSITEELWNRFAFKLPVLSNQDEINRGVISLVINPGSVAIGETTDSNRIALTKQAYKLTLNKNKITITANAAPGLFYGVQTLLQLLEKKEEVLVFPGGEIVDWPDMNLRMIYWDDAHHLEYMAVLKREIKQAAFFKINAFALKLEGHFQFGHAKPIVEPYALSPLEYQELTDYALAHYVQLVPYLDAPAHVSFILKHPEYAGLRSFPNCNYEMNASDPKTDSLLLGMFGDLINANKGVEYILLSTDESYYIGKSPYETEAAKAAGGNGSLLARFIARISNELSKRGRKVLFWGEYPLTLPDIKLLPAHLINGEYDSAWAPAFRDQGIGQMIYTAIQGEEPLFPNYYPLSAENRLHPENGIGSGNVKNVLETIKQAVSQKKANMMGVIVAGWADAGLHPQTFWLGYATAAAAGWNSSILSDTELTGIFYNAFYGAGSIQMEKVYQLLSEQAQFFDDSWEWYDSDLRSPILGNHLEIFKKPKPAQDQTLQSLPTPASKNLSVNTSWSGTNQKRLRLTDKFLNDNDELIKLLHRNLRTVSFNRYNVEVMLTIAELCRQNLMMIKGLALIDRWLTLSSAVAGSNPSVSVSLLDQSLDEAGNILKSRNKVLNDLVSVWYQDWTPLFAEANGRKYLQQVDDVKDHEPIRTIDLSYLVYRQIHYPLEKWAKETLKARNIFAVKNKLPVRKIQLPWNNIE